MHSHCNVGAHEIASHPYISTQYIYVVLISYENDEYQDPEPLLLVYDPSTLHQNVLQYRDLLLWADIVDGSEYNLFEYQYCESYYCSMDIYFLY